MNKNKHSQLRYQSGNGKPDMNYENQDWQTLLSPEEYRVLRQGGTEAPHQGKYTDTTTEGVYHCKACDAQLFTSAAKFPAHCGWPAFFTPLAKDSIIERPDPSHGMNRTEVLCKKCHSHLGHVFSGENYPTPTDLRYCINSICLRLEPKKSQ